MLPRIKAAFSLLIPGITVCICVILRISNLFPEIIGLLKKWLIYKSEKKQTYKPVGLETLKKKLIKLSSGDGDIAMKVVEQSMSNNWAGLFPLREERKDSNQDIGIVLHNSQEKDYNKGKW